MQNILFHKVFALEKRKKKKKQKIVLAGKVKSNIGKMEKKM